MIVRFSRDRFLFYDPDQIVAYQLRDETNNLSWFVASDKERFPTSKFGLIGIYAIFSMLKNFLFGVNLFDIRFCVIRVLVPWWCLGWCILTGGKCDYWQPQNSFLTK